MENKKVALGAVAAEAGKNAKAFWGKAKETIVNVADQNDDGSLDLKDISVVAGSIGNAAKEQMAQIREVASTYPAEDVLNMDETSFFWKMQPDEVYTINGLQA